MESGWIKAGWDTKAKLNLQPKSLFRQIDFTRISPEMNKWKKKRKEKGDLGR